MMPAGAIQAGQYQMHPVLHNPFALQIGLAQTYIQEAKRRDHPLLRNFWANQNPLLRAVLLADDPTQAAHAMPESPNDGKFEVSGDGSGIRHWDEPRMKSSHFPTEYPHQ